MGYNEGVLREKVCEDETIEHICSICGVYYLGYGNNSQPINDGRCCDECNSIVVSRRIFDFNRDNKNECNNN